jgi:hypothetical protein
MMYQDQIILDGVPLRGARYLEQLATCLARLHNVGTAHDKANNRQFFCDQYVGLLLLYLFNPTVRKLRGMRKLTDLASVQRRLGCRRASLSSLSEAGSASDAERDARHPQGTERTNAGGAPAQTAQRVAHVDCR